MARVIKTDVTPTTGVSAVVKLTDFQAQAEAILQQARQQAQRIVGEARAEAENIRRQSQHPPETLEAPGAAEAVATDKSAELAEVVESLRNIVAELSAVRPEMAENAAKQMLRFAVEIAEKIVGRVAVTDISAAEVNLQKALDLCAGQAVTVRVNPAQLELLRRYCAEPSTGPSGPGRILLVADEQVAPGGVNVITDGGTVDATIQTQWATVVEALLGSTRVQEITGSYIAREQGDEAIQAGKDPDDAVERLRSSVGSLSSEDRKQTNPRRRKTRGIHLAT
jgi:flagellar biosynthesis/type III secretory pathway protein FliH